MFFSIWEGYFFWTELPQACGPSDTRNCKCNGRCHASRYYYRIDHDFQKGRQMWTGPLVKGCPSQQPNLLIRFGSLCFSGSVSWCQRWQNFRNSPVPLSLFSRHSWNVFILLLSLSNPSVQDSPWFPGVIKQMYVENVQREVDGVLTREHLSDKHWAELKIVPPSHL